MDELKKAVQKATLYEVAECMFDLDEELEDIAEINFAIKPVIIALENLNCAIDESNRRNRDKRLSNDLHELALAIGKFNDKYKSSYVFEQIIENLRSYGI